MYLTLGAAIAILASVAGAAPSPAPAPGPQTLKLSTVTVPREVSHQLRKRTNELQGRGNDEEALYDYGFDQRYITEIRIGTPPQTLRVMADTGSDILWIMGKSCTDHVCQDTGNLFDESQSTTFRSLGIKDEIHYGGGDHATYVDVKDTVEWAGYSVRDKTFAYVYDLSDQAHWFADMNLTGLIGLGWAAPGVPFSPMPQYLAKNYWTDPRFGLYLARRINYDNFTGVDYVDGGWLTVNGIDESFIDGEVNYNTVVRMQGQPWQMWMIQSDSVTINGKAMQGSENNYCLLDSGAPTIVGPRALVDAAYKQIPTAHYVAEGDYYVLPCSTIIDLKVSFGGKEYPIYYQDLLWPSSDPEITMCRSMLQPSDRPYWVFGAAFMKNVYSVFRYEPPAIGLGYLTAKANQLFPGDTMTGPAAASGSSSSANATAKAAVSVPSGIDNSPAPIPVGNNTALNQTAVDAVADNGTVAAPSGAGSTPANSSGPSSTPSSAAGQGVTTFGVQALAGLFGACAALAVLL